MGEGSRCQEKTFAIFSLPAKTLGRLGILAAA